MEDNINNPNATLEDFNHKIAEAFAGQEIDDSSFEPAMTDEDAKPDTESQTQTQDTTAQADSSLKTEETQTENTENKTEPTPTKSFEELLAERTGGKFSKWEELEAALNTPKEDFFDEEVRRINELKKNGVKIDQDWFYLQTRDYENMEDPIEILAEAMKLENPGLTDKEIEWEIRSKYRLDEWTQDGQDEDEITPKQKEIEEVFSAKMLREANQKRDELIAKRNSQSWKTPKNPEAEAKAIAEAKAAQEAWEKSILDVDSKTTKLSTAISDKDAFEFVIEPSEKSDVSKMMKEMGTNAGVFWQQFVEDGKINQQKVYETIIKARNYDKAVTSAYQKGLAKGAEQEVKNLKNISFNQDKKVDNSTGIQDPIAKALADHFLKGN